MQISSEVIYENDETFAFLDAKPVAPGHAMVVPKHHAETLLDLPEALIGPLFLAVRHVTGMIKERLHPDGFTIGINHGRASGQAVDHLHVHIIPRFFHDGGSSLHGVVSNPPQEATEKIARTLRGE